MRAARTTAALLLGAGLVCAPAAGHAQDASTARPDTVDVDPIRCWWKTSRGAVRVGETFTLTLTCAALENDDVKVVPDQTPLAPAVVRLAPFEVVDGVHPSDERAGLRRFFQYAYTLRIVDPDAIGTDVSLPPLSLHYRVTSRVSGNAALEGRDLTYVLPSHSVRILSVVPADAVDVRDGTDASFGALEELTFRAGALSVAAATLAALALLMAGATLVRVLRRVKPIAARAAPPLRSGAVRREVARELAAVRRASVEEGWNEPLVARALAAVRIAAALGLERPVMQRAADADARPAEGQIVAMPSRLRRRGAIALSSTVTAFDVEQRLAGAESRVSGREALEELHTALRTLGTALYEGEAAADAQVLDGAIAQASLAIDRISTRRGCLLARVKQRIAGGTGAERLT